MARRAVEACTQGVHVRTRVCPEDRLNHARHGDVRGSAGRTYRPPHRPPVPNTRARQSRTRRKEVRMQHHPAPARAPDCADDGESAERHVREHALGDDRFSPVTVRLDTGRCPSGHRPRRGHRRGRRGAPDRAVPRGGDGDRRHHARRYPGRRPAHADRRRPGGRDHAGEGTAESALVRRRRPLRGPHLAPGARLRLGQPPPARRGAPRELLLRRRRPCAGRVAREGEPELLDAALGYALAAAFGTGAQSLWMVAADALGDLFPG